LTILSLLYYIALQNKKWSNVMSTAISVRLPDGVANKLGSIAKETERSRSFLVQKAVEMYINDFADLQVAIDRLRDNSDPVVSSQEMRESLGL
jgi:RHH-type rel operon transcriptional repressor/antitoxin RelB